jgi:hypothetical protein
MVAIPAAHSTALEYTSQQLNDKPIEKEVCFRAGEPRKEACRWCAAVFIGNGTEWIDSIPGFMVRPSLLYPTQSYTVVHRSDRRITHVRKDPASTDYVRRFGVCYLVPNNPMFLLLFIPSRNSENAEMTCVSKAPIHHQLETTSQFTVYGHTAHYTRLRVMTCDALYLTLSLLLQFATK